MPVSYILVTLFSYWLRFTTFIVQTRKDTRRKKNEAIRSVLVTLLSYWLRFTTFNVQTRKTDTYEKLSNWVNFGYFAKLLVTFYNKEE